MRARNALSQYAPETGLMALLATTIFVFRNLFFSAAFGERLRTFADQEFPGRAGSELPGWFRALVNIRARRSHRDQNRYRGQPSNFSREKSHVVFPDFVFTNDIHTRRKDTSRPISEMANILYPSSRSRLMTSAVFLRPIPAKR